MAFFNRFFSEPAQRIYSVMNEDHAGLYKTVAWLRDVAGRTCRTDEEGATRRADCLAVVQTLITDSRAHFQREEGLMHNYDYPLARQHAMEHVVLLRTLETFALRLRTEPAGLEDEDIAYLKDWLTRHIRNSDKHLESFLAGYQDKRTAKRDDLSNPGAHPWSCLFAFNDALPEGVASGNRAQRASYDAALEQRRHESDSDDGPTEDEINRRYQRAVWYE